MQQAITSSSSQIPPRYGRLRSRFLERPHPRHVSSGLYEIPTLHRELLLTFSLAPQCDSACLAFLSQTCMRQATCLRSSLMYCTLFKPFGWKSSALNNTSLKKHRDRSASGAYKRFPALVCDRCIEAIYASKRPHKLPSEINTSIRRIHWVLLQGSVVDLRAEELHWWRPKGRLRSSVQLHQRASVRYVACLIHV